MTDLVSDQISPKAVLPNIILVTDSHPCLNGGGISQTLYNILEGYESTIYLVDKANKLTNLDQDYLRVSILGYRLFCLPYLNNRVGLFLNNYIRKLNLLLLDFSNKTLINVERVDDSIILVSTTDVYKLLLAYKIHQQTTIPIVSYFMDDWLATEKLSWFTNDAQNLAKKLFASSVKWMFISDALRKALIKRYATQERPSMVLHNPVEVIDEIELGSYTNEEHNKNYKLVYAGSIWPMHVDAIELLAINLQTIGLMLQKHVTLDIYAPESHWNEYSNRLNQKNVFYRGFKRYHELTPVLVKADVLLVTASFTKEYAYYSGSSVQTKLTDYMRVSKPILSIAPIGSAINEFVKKWKCGLVVERNRNDDFLSDINIVLNKLLDHDQKFGYNGWLAVKTYFSKKVVREQFTQFMSL